MFDYINEKKFIILVAAILGIFFGLVIGYSLAIQNQSIYQEREIEVKY